jgi:SAM-dependent methyltransferase
MASPLRFSVDRCDREAVAGWVDQEGPVESLAIEINGHWICTLAPTRFRGDLRDAGLGDGRRGFGFGLRGYLVPGANLVTLRVGDEAICEKAIIEGSVTQAGGSPERHRAVADYSQRRWRGYEEDELLTWGRRMDATSLWEIYQRVRDFSGTDRILEIGSGYGRVLSTAIERGVPFSSYVGVELSEERVRKLSQLFDRSGVEFVVGDINHWQGNGPFDVVICSATFEHLYPDCRAALRNLRTQISGQADVFIDFIRSERSHAGFEANSAYVRTYSEPELRHLFAECGYTVRAVERCILGEGSVGPVERYVVIAQPA